MAQSTNDNNTDLVHLSAFLFKAARDGNLHKIKVSIDDSSIHIEAIETLSHLTYSASYTCFLAYIL